MKPSKELAALRKPKCECSCHKEGRSSCHPCYLEWNPEPEFTDAARLNWLEAMMTPDEDYCEIFLAGLRNFTGKASSFQVEANPEKFQTTSGPDLRAAIDSAMRQSRGAK